MFSDAGLRGGPPWKPNRCLARVGHPDFRWTYAVGGSGRPGHGHGHILRGRIAVDGRRRFARAAFAGAHGANFFNQVDWAAAALAEECVGAVRPFAGTDGIADEDHGHVDGDLLEMDNEGIAIHLGQPEVGKNEIDRRRREDGDCFFAADGGVYAVAAGLQEKCSDRKNLFIVVDAENDFLWTHSSFFSLSGQSLV